MQNQSKRTIKTEIYSTTGRLLKEQYGSKVEISTSKNIGKITFEFKSEDEFKKNYSAIE